MSGCSWVLKGTLSTRKMRLLRMPLQVMDRDQSGSIDFQEFYRVFTAAAAIEHKPAIDHKPDKAERHIDSGSGSSKQSPNKLSKTSKTQPSSLVRSTLPHTQGTLKTPAARKPGPASLHAGNSAASASSRIGKSAQVSDGAPAATSSKVSEK